MILVLDGIDKTTIFSHSNNYYNIIEVTCHVQTTCIRYESINSNSFTAQKCPNTELFLVHIFLYSVQIQENKDQK